MAHDINRCSICKSLPLQIASVTTFNDHLTGKSSEGRLRFFKTVNGCINSGKSAFLVILTDGDSVDKLGLFDQKVDAKLKELIPDGSLFIEVFSRTFQSADHIVYRIKAREPNGPLSVLTFNTLESLNKGIAEISNPQFSKLLTKVISAETPGEQTSAESNCLSFKRGEKVEFERKVRGVCLPFNEPFKESARVQAKAITGPEKTVTSESDVDKLVEVCWKHTLNYITSFSKDLNGGSIFFGVSEEKTKAPLWEEAPKTETETVFNIQWVNDDRGPRHSGPSARNSIPWKIYKHPNPAGKSYIVAPENKNTKEIATGKFKGEGVEISRRFEESFRTKFQPKLKELVWLGLKKPEAPVEVTFHPATQHPDIKIIEIRVKYYHGICFSSKDGPELYMSQKFIGGTVELQKVKKEEWLASFPRFSALRFLSV